MNLPAGLLPGDHRIEFFRRREDTDVCFAVTDGKTCRVRDLPAHIKARIWAHMVSHPKKIGALLMLGITNTDAKLEKFCGCNFGLFDGTADFDGERFCHEEYVPCTMRDSCPVNGVLCNPLTINGNALTHRQSEVLILVGRACLNKEIAAELGISNETVKKHVLHLQQLSGSMNKKDLVYIAAKKQLV
jgi:DNA-binding CsgD family transcriptional regulator